MIQISEEIIKVLDHICDKLGVAVDWTSQNVMSQVTDVMNRYISYNIIINTLAMIICIVVLTITGVVLFKGIYKGYISVKTKKCSNLFYRHSPHYSGLDRFDLSAVGFAAIVFSISFIVVCVAVLRIHINSLIRWSIVPEIEIINMLQQMV